MSTQKKRSGKVSLDRAQAYKIFDILVDLYQRKAYPYNKKEAVLPQTLIPESLKQDEKKHALFLFYACHYMRGMVRSTTAFSQLVKAQEAYPWMFVPEEVLQHSQEEVLAVLKEFLGIDAKNISRYWFENSYRLSWWGNDPRNLCKGVRSFEDLTDRVCSKNRRNGTLVNQGFLGFQKKMASMLAYFLIDAGLIEDFSFPPPIDFHHMRIALATKALVLRADLDVVRYSEDVVAPLRNITLPYCKSRGIHSVVLADALWLYSLIMCGKSPVNADSETENVYGSAQKATALFGELPRKRVSRSLKWHMGYGAICGTCPIQHECAFSVPSRLYYLQGKLRPRERPKLDLSLQPTIQIASEETADPTLGLDE